MSSASDRDDLLAGVARTYRESLAEHGPVSKGVGWKDEASQTLRFEQLARVVGSGPDGFSVNDLGCGYGALFGFLVDRFGDRLQRYVGYEISGEMLAVARERITDRRASFSAANAPTEIADYSFVSGTFNVKLDASEDAWEAYIKETLAKLAACSRRGFAFNLLTTDVDWREPHLFYGDPGGFADFCTNSLNGSVSLISDYGLYEWTLVVRTKSA